MIVSPNSVASLIAIVPIPLVPPCTSTVSPSATYARSNRYIRISPVLTPFTLSLFLFPLLLLIIFFFFFFFFFSFSFFFFFLFFFFFFFFLFFFFFFFFFFF